MLNCGSIHRHKYSDPVTEVNQRVTYLADQGGERIILGCHDRGDAQVFAYLAEVQHPAVMTAPGHVYYENAQVTAGSFLDYDYDTMQRDTPTNLKSIKIPEIVIAGSLDTLVTDLPEGLDQASLGAPTLLEILAGADHFFRDLEGDDLATLIAEQAGR
jgi:hypothetical protein